MALSTRAQSANLMQNRKAIDIHNENSEAVKLSKLGHHGIMARPAPDVHNENSDAVKPSKIGRGVAARPASHMGQRSALGDIRNKVSAITIDPSKKSTAIKKEIVQQINKQSSVLNKNKATSSLKSLVDHEHVKQVVEPPQASVLDTKAAKILIPEQTAPSLSLANNVSVLPKNVLYATAPTTTTTESMDISADKPEAFSKALLIEDIDVNDKDNPQLVSEYVNDIYDYMRVLEEKYTVRPDFLVGQEVSGKMRSILIDWLCQVHHRFQLLQETLYLTVSIIDRFLQVHPVPRNKLQLVGVTSMLVASKYEEMYAPEVADFVYITDNAYTKKDIHTMEQLILKTLDFCLGKPLCLHFLRRNSKAGQVDASKHTLAKYLMELTIVEYDMVQYNPSQIAAAALSLSMRLLDGSKWTETLSHYSSYSEKDLVPTMKKLASLVIKAENSKLTAVRTKYASSKFMKISQLPELKSKALQDLATES